MKTNNNIGYKKRIFIKRNYVNGHHDAKKHLFTRPNIYFYTISINIFHLNDKLFNDGHGIYIHVYIWPKMQISCLAQHKTLNYLVGCEKMCKNFSKAQEIQNLYKTAHFFAENESGMPFETLCHFKNNIEFDCATVVILVHIQIRNKVFRTNFLFML